MTEPMIGHFRYIRLERNGAGIYHGGSSALRITVRANSFETFSDLPVEWCGRLVYHLPEKPVGRQL